MAGRAGGDLAELDTAAVRWLYEEAGRAGMAQLVVWGGEPLLRQDLPELLLAARRAGLFTTLITNGWLLGARWAELRGLVDALILSLDDVGAAHDGLRGLPGSSSASRPSSRRWARSAAADAARQHGAVTPQPRGAGAGRGGRRALARRPVLLPDGDRRGRRRPGSTRRSPVSPCRPASCARRPRLAAELKAAGLPDPRLAAVPRAARARPGADRIPLPCPAGAPDRRRRRRSCATACDSDRPLARRAALRAAGEPLSSAVPVAPLPAHARAGGRVHQVQQPGRDRALVALGPASGDARQGRGAGAPVTRRRGFRSGGGRPSLSSRGRRRRSARSRARPRARGCARAARRRARPPAPAASGRARP